MSPTPKKKPSPRARSLQQFLASIGDRPMDAHRRSDVPYTTIHSFLIGKTQKMEPQTEQSIADSYARTVEEIFGGKLVEPVPKPKDPGDVVRIGKDHFWPVPAYDVRAAAGVGAFVDDGEPQTYQLFRDQFLQRITASPLSALSVIYVTGDSMWDTLHAGDMVLVDRSEQAVAKDGIYVLRVDHGLIVKRCSFRLPKGGIIVSSDNPKYPQQIIDDPRDLDVLGRVIWISRAIA